MRLLPILIISLVFILLRVRENRRKKISSTEGPLMNDFDRFPYAYFYHRYNALRQIAPKCKLKTRYLIKYIEALRKGKKSRFHPLFFNFYSLLFQRINNIIFFFKMRGSSQVSPR